MTCRSWPGTSLLGLPLFCAVSASAVPGASGLPNGPNPIVGRPATADPNGAQPGPDEQARLLATLFRDLRFEENRAALPAPDVRTEQQFPEVTLAGLDDEGDWAASFGGQARWQYKAERNRDLMGGRVPNTNDYHLLRLRLHGDLHYRDDARVFVEAISAGVHANDAPPLASDENDADLLNAFIEFPNAYKDMLVRVGRTELSYGAERVISPVDWANTRRTFQGGLVRLTDTTDTTDIFLVQPVTVAPHDDDDPDRSRWFGGVYNTRIFETGGGLDTYGLVLSEHDDVVAQSPVPGATMGDMDAYTLGGRYWGRSGETDYELEGAWQFGDRAGNTIKASMWSAVFGYTLTDCSWEPRIAIDFDFASGDSRPGDDEYNTFNQLFPDWHSHLGLLDAVGRQNVMAFMPSLTLQLAPTLTLRVAYADLELAQTHDFLYDATGTPISPASALDGSGGKDIGQEADVTLAWRPAGAALNGEFLFGYSEMHPAAFVDGFGDGHPTQLFYAQFQFTF